MRVLMFGRGVIATTYGHAFQAAGHEVEYYVRPGRAAEYGGEVRIDLVDGRRRRPLGRRSVETTRTRLRESISPDDAFDLVVLSVGHHRLAEAAAFLAPRIGDATVLVFGNVWDEPPAAVAPLPADLVVFGFPQAGGGFADDGVLTAALLGSVIIGATGEAPNRRELAVHGAFRQADVTVRTERDMRGWLWLHFVFDAGIFAQGLRSGGLANMVGDREALREAFANSRELLPVVEARGVDLRRHRGTTLPARLPGLTGAVFAQATARLPIARVSLSAHTDPHAAEPRAVIDDTLREAHRLGVPVPRLESALEHALGSGS